MVVNQIFNNDDTIIFEDKLHQYFTRIERKELKSTSKVLEIVKKPFDAKTVSLRMAHGNTIKQQQILKEWDGKRDNASRHGNFIHNNLEDYSNTGKYDERFSDVIKVLSPIISSGYRHYAEGRIYSMEHMVAGTADLVIQRQRSEKSVFDFYDYKTNLEKGIVFDSVRRKDGKITHYNNFLLPPLQHLEDCNYNHYVLQLSIYALMAELTWGIRVGRLAILFINKELAMKIIPVAYMRSDALTLLNHYKNLKSLPDDDW